MQRLEFPPLDLSDLAWPVSFLTAMLAPGRTAYLEDQPYAAFTLPLVATLTYALASSPLSALYFRYDQITQEVTDYVDARLGSP